MDSAAVIWLGIFAISAVAFFAIAAVVAVRGLDDLKKLLRNSKHGDEKEKYEL
ncbi:MAG: hypothetical protein AB7V18_19725 [Pyrinomonadaceae bacterium]